MRTLALCTSPATVPRWPCSLGRVVVVPGSSIVGTGAVLSFGYGRPVAAKCAAIRAALSAVG